MRRFLHDNGGVNGGLRLWCMVGVGVVALVGLYAVSSKSEPQSPYKPIGTGDLGLDGKPSSGMYVENAVWDWKWMAGRWEGKRVALEGRAVKGESLEGELKDRIRIIELNSSEHMSEIGGVFCKGGGRDLLRWPEVIVSGTLHVRETSTPLGRRVHYYEIEVDSVRDRSPPVAPAPPPRWPIPTLIGLCGAATWCIVRAVRKFRVEEWRLRGCCPECGYDLRASAERCPECGALYDGATTAQRGYYHCCQPPKRSSMKVLNLATGLAVILALPMGTRADEMPVRLKTQAISFKLVRDDPDIEGRRDRTIELVHLPAGTLVLKGPDGKDHQHVIKPIWIARYETRWDEYNVFWRGLDMTEEAWKVYREARVPRAPEERQHWLRLRERPEKPYWVPWGNDHLDGGQFGVEGYPANCVHFQAGVKYCAWLSKLTGKKFRLPTEPEWEYACRAGGAMVKRDAKDLADFAWFWDNSKQKPHPVGRKKPNAWGLYDMLGNVGEYVIRDLKDDKGLIAGGTFKDDAKDVHCAAREPFSPDWQKNDPEDPKSTSWLVSEVPYVGFRVVMEE